MAYEFTCDRLVEFADTDAAGIAHFSSLFRFMENAEHAFFRSLGLSITLESGGKTYSFPRVHAEADFHGPLRFEDTARTHLIVREVRPHSLVFDYALHRVREGNNDFIARGTMTNACVTLHHGQMRSAPIPPQILEKIQPAPPAALERFHASHA